MVRQNLKRSLTLRCKLNLFVVFVDLIRCVYVCGLCIVGNAGGASLSSDTGCCLTWERHSELALSQVPCIY